MGGLARILLEEVEVMTYKCVLCPHGLKNGKGRGRGREAAQTVES